MRRIIACFVISGCTCACFASAVVLAQAGGGGGAQAPAAAPAKKGVTQKGVVTIRGNIAVNQEGDDPTRRVLKQARPPMPVRQPVQPNRAPLIQQFTSQALPLLRAELVFARNVCHLNRDELRKLNREAQKMLDEVVVKLVDAQAQPRVRVQSGGRAPNNLDAHQLLRDGVVAVMKANLNTGQWQAYQAERQKRDENRKRATIRYFVDSLDRELYLSPGQCKELEEAFEYQWDPLWTTYLENHLLGNKYYPMSVDPMVTPLLTEAQKKVWGGLQKVGVYWGFAAMTAGFGSDPDDLAAELGEPARPGEQRNPMHEMMKMQQLHMGGDVIDVVPAAPALPAATVKKKNATAKSMPKQVQ
jgi:hypothetical protein